MKITLTSGYYLLVVLSLSVGITFVLYSFPYTYSQINNNNNFNNNSTIAEDFKDCFLQLKDSSDIDGSDINNLIMMLCYETYKGEGVFNHQLSKEQISVMNQKIGELRQSSDLEKILSAFQ